jgi:hypothetical protein
MVSMGLLFQSPFARETTPRCNDPLKKRTVGHIDITLVKLECTHELEAFVEAIYHYAVNMRTTQEGSVHIIYAL